MPITRKETKRLISDFDPEADGLAAKSKDLIQMLLRHGLKPFSARQYWPGHITCTALILHPREQSVLVIYHARLRRWLLPGGHVEKRDFSLSAVAEREAQEETSVRIDQSYTPFLTGIDVHGIPPKQREPFHLHHDLIWCFRAATDEFAASPEAPKVMWANDRDWELLDLTASIRLSIGRAMRVACAQAGC